MSSYSAVLTSVPRGQCILPFHCSMVCSLSSSCLSEIWGGGCETKWNMWITQRSYTAAVMKNNTFFVDQFPHRVCLCRVVPHVNVGVVEGFLHRDTAFRIDDQHFGEQVPRLGSCFVNKRRAESLRKRVHGISSKRSSRFLFQFF